MKNSIDLIESKAESINNNVAVDVHVRETIQPKHLDAKFLSEMTGICPCLTDCYDELPTL